MASSVRSLKTLLQHRSSLIDAREIILKFVAGSTLQFYTGIGLHTGSFRVPFGGLTLRFLHLLAGVGVGRGVLAGELLAGGLLAGEGALDGGGGGGGVGRELFTQNYSPEILFQNDRL
jgi:hypothetical protein